MDLKVMSDRKRKRKMGFEQMRCNLCRKAFRAQTKFHRFCRSCKLDEDLFRFCDWLPDGASMK